MEAGEPLSWRHFVYGARYLSRAYARESLQAASAARVGAAAEGALVKAWFHDQARAAGWE